MVLQCTRWHWGQDPRLLLEVSCSIVRSQVRRGWPLQHCRFAERRLMAARRVRKSQAFGDTLVKGADGVKYNLPEILFCLTPNLPIALYFGTAVFSPLKMLYLVYLDQFSYVNYFVLGRLFFCFSSCIRYFLFLFGCAVDCFWAHKNRHIVSYLWTFV